MDWKLSKVLIAGASGFLGKHLVSRLQRAGYRHLITPRRAEFDLTHPDTARRLLDQERPALVIHLAAVVGGIGANRAQPGTFLYQNLAMGTHLIEASRRANVAKFVMIGTICSYPKLTPVPFRESDFWNGYPEETNAPYGLAKKLLVAQLQAYRQEFGFPGVNLLITNLYGPGDHFDLETSHVIPALIRKCVEARLRGDRAVSVWGTGRPTREFLYVEDAARAIQLAAERLDTVEPVNVGSGQEIAIADLARMIVQKTGFRGEITFDPSQPDGQPRRRLDVSQARALFDFTASTLLSEGLDRTIAWYLDSRAASSRAA